MNSDKSQPIKIFLILVFGIAIVILGIAILVTLKDTKNTRNFGFGINETSFATNTTSSVTCANASSVLALAENSARANFLAANNGASGAYLCRTGAKGCNASSGIYIAPTSSAQAISYYLQTDGYFGAYSCTGADAGTTTLMIWSN